MKPSSPDLNGTLAWRWLAAMVATVASINVASAEVRVYFDRTTFISETASSQLTQPYPFFQGASFTSGIVTFTQPGGGLFFNEWTPAFPGNDLAISGIENFDFSFALPFVHAAGIEVIEPSCADCVDSTFEFIVFGNADASALGMQAELHRETVNFPDDQAAFIGFSSDRRIVRIAVREIVGTDDNEYFGRVYGSVDRPSSIAGGTDVRVQEFNQPIQYPIPFSQAFDFGMLPLSGFYRGVHNQGIEVIASGPATWVHVDGSPLGARSARQPGAAERWTLSLPPNSHALEFGFYESSLPGSAANSCFNTSCFDTLYRVRAWNGATLIRDQQFSAWNDRPNRYGLWSNVAIDKVELEGFLNNSDDELLGTVRISTQPLPNGFPQRIASLEGTNFGREVAVSGDFAVATDRSGFSTWRRVGSTWNRLGRRPVDGDSERIAVDADHVAIARQVGNGGLLAVFNRSDAPPESWPAPVVFEYSGAARDLVIGHDIMALGLSGQVTLFSRTDADGWQPAGELLPPPGASNLLFGAGLGLEADLLVVGAGDGKFLVYRAGPGATFTQEFFKDSASSLGTTIVDITDGRIALQGFSGEVDLYVPQSGGSWTLAEILSAPLPFVPSSGLGSGVAIDGSTVLARKSFSDASAPDARQAVEVWQQLSGGQWQRSFVLADPHLAGNLGAGLGGLNIGQAMSLSGDAFWLGQPASPWCVGPSTAFFGDNGSQGYAGVCGGRSGAVFIGSLAAIGDRIFSDGFEGDLLH